MKMNGIALLGLAMMLGTTAIGSPKAYGNPNGSATPVLGQDRGWDAPPGELNETQRRGFRDGIEGARKDFENHRRFTPDNRDEYRNPHLPFDLREAYQEGFRRGYAVGVAHLTQPPMRDEPRPPMQMAQPAHHGWGIVLDALTDIQRRGYQEGMEGARRDFENHRRPDPNNRDEYRDPPVPPGLRDEYREGFRRGYEEAVAQRMGEVEQGEWNAAPGRFSEIQRRGFQDGMEGARRDFENHRRPDPDNRDEYRNPNVPPQLRDEYREGFRRGYERTIAHLTGEPERR
jgi:ribosome modulation factor